MNRKSGKSPVDWLLEPEDIGVRYLALRDLVDADVKELAMARKQAHERGRIAQVLAKMEKEGYWVKPGAGYYPKYTGTVWSFILLAQLGASLEIDSRIKTACFYILDHTLTDGGRFSVNGLNSGTADCLQGNLCASLLDLGCKGSRLEKAFEWMARSVTGEGVAPKTDKKAQVRYYAGKCGPNFAAAQIIISPVLGGRQKSCWLSVNCPREKEHL